jgi:hypothetical protein
MHETAVGQSRRPNQRGSAIVEAALTLSMFMIFFLGIFDVGIMLFRYQSYTARAKQAARYGSTNPGDTTGIRNVVLYDSPAAPGGGGGFWGLEANMVAVNRSGAGTPDDHITIQLTNYTMQGFSPLLSKAFQGPPIRASAPVEAVP